MNLEKKLASWVANRLLSPPQAEAILAHESRTPQRSWVVFGVVGIGVTAIATGIISLIAANWELIPVWLKLGNYFFLQIAFGIFVLSRLEKPGLARETSLTLFGLLFLAGIGLVAQVYHLRSDGWQGILFWTALALPATLLVHSRLLPHLWLFGLAIAVGIWMTSDFYFEGKRLTKLDRYLVGTMIAYLIAALGAWRYDRTCTLPKYFRGAALVWGTAALLTGVCGLAGEAWYSKNPSANLGMTLFPLAGVLAVMAALLLSRPAYESKLRFAAVGMYVSLYSYLCLPLTVPLGEQKILGCLGFVIVWTFAAATAVFGGSRRLFDLATLVIAARFIVVYFEVFGSLAATGVGLIISGVFIIAAAVVWHRYRQRLALWLEARR